MGVDIDVGEITSQNRSEACKKFCGRAFFVVLVALPIVAAIGATLISFNVNVLKKRTFFKIFIPIASFPVVALAELIIFFVVVFIIAAKRAFAERREDLVVQEEVVDAVSRCTELPRAFKTLILDVITHNSKYQVLYFLNKLRIRKSKIRFWKVQVKPDMLYSNFEFVFHDFSSSPQYIDKVLTSLHQKIYNCLIEIGLVQVCNAEEIKNISDFTGYVVINSSSQQIGPESREFENTGLLIKPPSESTYFTKTQVAWLFRSCFQDKRYEELFNRIIIELMTNALEGSLEDSVQINIRLFFCKVLAIKPFYDQCSTEFLSMRKDELSSVQRDLIKTFKENDILKEINLSNCDNYDVYDYDNSISIDGKIYMWNLFEKEKNSLALSTRGRADDSEKAHPFNVRISSVVERFIDECDERYPGTLSNYIC